jgi:hypothetical protein
MFCHGRQTVSLTLHPAIPILESGTREKTKARMCRGHSQIPELLEQEQCIAGWKDMLGK